MTLYRKLELAFFVLSLSVACATSPAPPAPAPAPDPRDLDRAAVEALQSELPLVLKAQGEALWKSWTEAQLAGDSGLAERESKLFTAEAVEAVARVAREATDPREALGLRRLKLYLESVVLARRSAEASEKVATILATATVGFDGYEVPFRDLEARLAAEAHAGQRRVLARRAAPVLRRLEAALLARDAEESRILRELGYESTGAFAVALREVEPARLAALAEEILSRTEERYREAMAARAREESKLAFADLRRADVPRLFRTGLVDSYFPKDRMRSSFESALGAMGVGLEQVGVRLDAEPRPRKAPRALAMAVEVPGDVRLSIKPAAGLEPFAQALHEAGRAVALASVAEPSFELGYLGSSAPAQVIAELFEGLVADPGFAAGLGVPEARAAGHVRARALKRLYDLRLEAARLLCDVAWYGASADRRDVCRQAFGRAQGFPMDESDEGRWVFERRSTYASASRLAALVAAGQLEALLIERHGERWWADPRSGALIRKLLASASAQSIDAWVSSWAGKGLDVALLLQRLEERLRSE
ncbi:MAG: hypothetical protein ACOX6T_23195 [Myxococcales bacterium]|jgi:hypothetical protein